MGYQIGAITQAANDNSTKIATTAYTDNALAGKQNAITLTTTGTSGAATFNQSTGALNIPAYTGGSGSVDKLGWYNIVTDYSADNTGVNDATTAINNAITAATASRGTVYLPKGTYKIAGTIHWNTNVNLMGENWTSTILKASAAVTMLDVNGQTTIKENTGTICNIEFDGNSIGVTGIDLQFQIMFHHHHLYFHHFTGYATKLTGCIAGEFNTCHWVMNANGSIQGIRGTDSVNGTMQPNAMLFSNCLIHYTTNTFAVDWANSAGLKFTNNCVMENNGTNGNANTGFLTFSGASPTGEGIALIIQNCWAEMNKGTFIRMGNAQAENRTIISNSIIKFGSATYNIHLTGDNGNKNIVSVQNCRIEDATTNVYATGANAVVEVQNSLIGNYSMVSGAAYYQYNPTLMATGSGGGGTNLLPNPRAFNLWTANAVTVTTNATTSPDGTTNADKIAATVTNTNHFVSQAITKAASSVSYTASVDIAPSGVSLVELNIQTASGNGVIGKYNVTTGAVVAAPVAFGSGFAVTNSSITSVGNGFYRIVIAFSTNSETDLTMYVAMSTAFAGNGTNGIFLDNGSLI